MNDKIESFILVDGSSYLYRAYHAQVRLTTQDGYPTWVIHIVLNMLRKLQNKYPDSNLVMVFDAKGKCFRHLMYAEYKANRSTMPDDLILQINPLYKIIKAMGIPLIIKEGVEADDVIGSLTSMLIKNGHQVVISTIDKDMAQLVNDQVVLYDAVRDKIIDVKAVKERFGIHPSLIIDWLALQGDASDNIPGVPGVGEKTAKVLLQELGGLTEIYKNLSAISSLKIRGAKSLADRLLQYRDQAFLCYKLATILTELHPEVEIASLYQSDVDHSTLVAWFKKLEMNAWLQQLKIEKVKSGVADFQYEVILDESALLRWIDKLRHAPYFAFDTETTDLNYMQADLVGMSFAIDSHWAAYVPCAHDYDGVPQQLALSRVLELLKPLLEDTELPKIGQHLKYDKHILARYGVVLNGFIFDTMLESHLLNSIATRHDLDSLAKFYLGEDTVKFTDIAGKGAKQKNFKEISLECAAHYAAEDAIVAFRLHQLLWSSLQDHPKLLKIYRDIDQPLIAILARMEQNGTLINCSLLEKLTNDFQARMLVLEQEVFALAGKSFNLSSTKQLQVILFEDLSLPVIKKTPKGQPSTAEEVLVELALHYDLPAKLLQYRRLAKLCSTYTGKLVNLVNIKTGRVHTSFHQAGTSTGRLSSSDPNLQNIPIRTEEGSKIRQAFIPATGCALVVADYSQIELRIMADLSQDEGMRAAFYQGLDIHSVTASEVFNVPQNQVTREQRYSAKGINFGLIYGMSPFGLAKQLGISREDASQYMKCYFDRYPKIKQYMDTVRESAKSCGFVETLLGRRLYIPNINSPDRIKQQAAMRTAINAPMQGTSADIIKLAMISVDEWIIKNNLQIRMIIQVHDELVFEVPKSAVLSFCSVLKKLMSNAYKLTVPLEVVVGHGNNWHDATLHSI